MTTSDQSQHVTTRLLHHPYKPPQDFISPQIPVYKASTVFFDNVAAARARRWLDKSSYTYGLHGTPSTYTLEERLCTLEGARQCLLAPSGLAALSIVSLALLSAGDHVLVPDNAYGPNKDFITRELARYGITHALFDPMDVQDLQSRLTPATRLVWLEAPGSVTMEFPDLVAQVQLCKQRGIFCALDNTWGAGVAFSPFDLLGDGSGLGVDVSVHALTKYPSGGADVLMGSITTRQDSLHMRIKLSHMYLGIGVGANDVELLLRSLPSTELRYSAQDQAARHLAAALARQEAVVQLLHPAFSDAPGHEHWQQVCAGSQRAAGIFSIVLDPKLDQARVDAFCDALRLFEIGYSWGGAVSLVMPYQIDTMRTRPRSSSPIKKGTLVRFCIGLENVQDLERDLAQAYEAALGLGWA